MAWNPFKKSTKNAEKETQEQKGIKEKVELLKRTIDIFRGCLNEEFILGTDMAETFTGIFTPHIEKKGSSATKRWCNDVAKKLQKLDKSNEEFLEAHTIKPSTMKITRSGVEEETVLEGRGLSATDKATLKAKNIKEFKKIFYNSTTFDSKFFGTEIKVKPTFSQTAAINKVKKELNALCNPDNFKPKSSR